MKQKFFSRWFAIGMIATALVMIGCSKDDKDNKNDEPAPPPPNAVMIDGEAKPITELKIGSDLEVYYEIYIELESELIRIIGEKEYHESKIIDLTQKEPENRSRYWSVQYHKSEEVIFNTFSSPGPYPVFQSGTLYLKRLADIDGQPVFEIELKNGKVKAEGRYGDGKEHTISLYYKGKLELIEL
ncbi:hypothetical protein [Capnocytophaga canimorsus]|uniref:Lipoprotein n=1 Tax=Capnocytophaga canimorsus (strain 5) TaxID=860228 RepID=F9YUN1_CAPCC|nr:hypothetical protein [Capnocytophaga canimorsus]AEK24268.1 Conserved hypothetical protein [Capnocytophaga canimorsus Cc5]WGU68777.1 hypothetical protein QIU19_02115 [Capnocytophaga canimorsus]WGU70119.1 hypothetical protein QIU18_11490 [Capnocytophaga canimorsus]